MKWFQKILATMALINMVISPVMAADWTAQEKMKLAQYRDYLEPLGYRLTVDPTSKKALVFDKSTNALAMEIPFSDEAHLRKFSPKSLNRMMMDEMVRVKSSSKAAWSHSVRNLPTESAIFFLAMGAVVAGQLITNYSQNPIAMKQHVDHSLSPLGVFGFFTFMYSQGVTSNILAMYMKNPKFHHMIPYLGMTVGAFIQTYLSQVASDPNVKACATTMMGGSITEKDRAAGVDQDPCAKAYEYLVIQKKIWEFAPGIVSMLISSGIAGVSQALLTKTVLRITGVDIALWLTPGSAQIKGFRLLLVKGLQITAFVAIDVWLNRKVVSAWKNFFDGQEFNDINEKIVADVNEMKRSQWSKPENTLQADLKTFRQKMTAWRMMNMSEVYEAHQNWSEALHQLTSMFNASQSFYGSFLTELRNSRFQQSDNRLLERTYPYVGIKALGLADGKEELFYTNPQFIESMQEDTIAESITKVETYLSGSKGKHLYPAERKKIEAILLQLKAEDRTKKANGLVILGKEVLDSIKNISTSPYYRQLLNEFSQSLGNPNPMMEKGRGFLATMEQAPMAGEALKGVNYYRQVGAFQTPKITDYLLMQMLCGPDIEKGEKIVKNSSGFPSVFLPPTLRNPNDSLNVCTTYGSSSMNVASIYQFSLKSSANKTYKGAIDYLIHEARETAVGPKDAMNFDKWWKNKTEAEMQKAFEEYGKEYDAIVSKLIDLVYRQDRSSLNRGPIANGAMNASFQELRVYLSLLQELLQPSSSYTLNMATILSNKIENKSLVNIERQFAILNGLIKTIKVVEKEGRRTIQSPLENYQLEEQLSNIQAALKDVSTLLGVGDSKEGAIMSLNQQQRDLAVTTLENLQALATEVMMYGSMANAVSWEKIRNLKRLNMEQQQFNNEIQAKLAAMRGLSMPGKQ